MAGVALGDMDRHFAWQGLALVARLGLGVAGVGDIELHFAWQVWHLVTSTITLRGRRGTW